jgi:hypothetical protein
MADLIVVVMLIGMGFRLIMRIGTPGRRALPRTSVSQKLRQQLGFSHPSGVVAPPGHPDYPQQHFDFN